MNSAWWTEAQAELRPLLAKLRVAVYASAGSPFHHAALIAQWGGVPEMLGAAEIRGGALDAYDVLIVPGGGLNAMGGLLAPLGQPGAARIHAWVERGGLYLGSCAGAYLGGRLPEHFLTANPAARDLKLLDVPMPNAGEGVLGGLDSPGVGVLEGRPTVPRHWLAHGLPERFEIVHYNGPCFLPIPGNLVSGAVTLAGLTERFTPWERSLPGQVGGEVLTQRLLEQGAQLAVSGPCGEGQVVLFGSHPEFGFSALQLGWGVAARLLGNALAQQTAQRGSTPGVPRLPVPDSAAVLPDIADAFARAGERFAVLQHHRLDLSGAPAFQGRSAGALWAVGLAEAAEVSASLAAYLHALAPLRPEVGQHYQWTDHEPDTGQDYGFVGLRQLARRVHELIDQAEAQLGLPLPAQTFPYDAWERSPYHLLVSSYLSAAGVIASASLAASTLGQLCGFAAPPPHPLTAPQPQGVLS
ncbi:hypothetical protein GCM10022631_00590 [Deinococcus rubellus]|uniref:BPL-N domain-containing protein n=1 Tax=Deinococcus rubellus TaxID=1889240 RepID=UPI0031E957F1